MAIKRVVDKPKTQVIKKFPEFDSNKIYVRKTSSTIDKLVQQNGRYFFDSINDTGSVHQSKEYPTFEGIVTIYNNLPIYILDNQQDLARFIMGYIKFPIVEEIEETVNKLADDEVSIDDCIYTKIYATLEEEYGIRLLNGGCHSHVNYELVSLTESYSGLGLILMHSKLDDAIKQVLGLFGKRELYQFDTQEEFLRWSLEQVTGKKFIKGRINVYKDSGEEVFG